MVIDMKSLASLPTKSLRSGCGKIQKTGRSPENLENEEESGEPSDKKPSGFIFDAVRVLIACK